MASTEYKDDTALADICGVKDIELVVVGAGELEEESCAREMWKRNCSIKLRNRTFFMLEVGSNKLRRKLKGSSAGRCDSVIVKGREQVKSHSFAKNVMIILLAEVQQIFKVLSVNLGSIIGPFYDFNSRVKVF